jgi:hypothetical protein
MRAYRGSGKLHPMNILAHGLIEPKTHIDKFLMAIDHAVMDAAIADPKNLSPFFGKWLIKVDRGEVDRVWKRLSYQIERGKIPYRAKVSTARKNPTLRDTPKGKHLICIYTPNYLWREDVRAARSFLREFGYHSKLYYRPDVITILETGSVSGTDFNRDIFQYLRKHGVKRPEIKYRYYG